MVNLYVNLAEPWCPAGWSNTGLDVAVKVFFRLINNQCRVSSVMWVGLIQSLEGLKTKGIQQLKIALDSTLQCQLLPEFPACQTGLQILNLRAPTTVQPNSLKSLSLSPYIYGEAC